MDLPIQNKTALIRQYQSGNNISRLIISKLAAPEKFVKNFFWGAAGLGSPFTDRVVRTYNFLFSRLTTVLRANHQIHPFLTRGVLA